MIFLGGMGELIVNSWGRGGSRGIVDPVADLLDGVAVVTAAEPPPTGHAGGGAAAGAAAWGTLMRGLVAGVLRGLLVGGGIFIA